MADSYHGKIKREGTSRQGLVPEFVNMVTNLQGLKNRKFLHQLNDYQVFGRSTSNMDLTKMFAFHDLLYNVHIFPPQSSIELKN